MTMRQSFTLESTGSSGMNEILGGGLPSQSVVVVAGEPGSGKTVFTLQTLFSAARRGHVCLYLTTLSEPAIKVIRYMQRFRFFDEELLEEKVIFADLSDEIGKGTDAVLTAIEGLIERHGATFIAIDSFRALVEQLGPRDQSRNFIFGLAAHMASSGATSLLVGEYTRQDSTWLPEFAIADGIILFGHERQELTSVRTLEVTKMRGMSYSQGTHFLDICPDGMRVFPRVSAPMSTQVQSSVSYDRRASTGIEGLDALLNGGLPVGSTTIVQGGTGIGKTLLSLQFLLEGGRRGEKGVLFTLEETPAQLRAVASAIGWDLAAAEAAGNLVIHYTSPVELSTDRFLHQAREEVLRIGATRAVFDSLTTMALGIPSERRFKELVYALAKHLRGDDVTLLMTSEAHQLLGSAEIGGHGVSFIADNFIQLRYVEVGGRLERAISVLKARGIAHSSELRAAAVGEGGLKVGEPFKDLLGVLTGRPTPDRARDR
jgi:circadian clock protein KaiC